MAEGPGCQCRDDDAVIGGAFGGTILEVTRDAEGNKMMTYLCSDCGLQGVIKVGSWVDALTALGYNYPGGDDAA